MSENSKIEWCAHTFNPWIGCTKVSPGCANCYAETLMDKRYGRVKWGKGNPRSRTSKSNWKQVERWNRQESETPENFRARRPRVFVASLADWLDPEVPIEWLADLLGLIRRCPHLDFLMLTKRPELWRERVEEVCGAAGKAMESGADTGLWQWTFDWLHGRPPANVWIGTSVEDQQRADERIPALLNIPAKVRFLSCEPLLGEVDLSLAMRMRHTDEGGIHWVICGGESGPNARPMHPDWARSLRDQCQAAGIPFFFKQWGAKVGKAKAGRLLDGREWSEFPHNESEVGDE